ncbi:MAG: 50S ribosomal protein L33 [Calditrichae bacterium]|nr:50S ribosomal protein L33 [Calditrichota bacterium]MCB9059649.1 50S ribosomal protein L33 [Calditrichia bacterium]
MRVAVTLECVQCKSRNYKTTKNKKEHPERLEQKKYCARCKEHVIHRETK